MEGSLKEFPVFFIIGRGRSGSTLLRSVFDAHPQVKVPLESRFVQMLYYRYHGRKSWKPEHAAELIRDLEHGFEPPDLDKVQFAADLQAHASELSFSNICKLIYLNIKPVPDRKDIQWIGDKNPRYSFFTETLLKLFPNARFIHLVRDYRDNISSIARSHKTLGESANPCIATGRWKFYNQVIERVKKKYPGRFITLRFEDLVNEPEKEVRRLCDFLSLEFLPSMLSYHKNIDSLYKDKTFSTLHGSLKNPFDTSRIGMWQQAVPLKTIRRCEVLAGRLPEKYSYHLEDSLRGAARWLALLVYTPLSFAGQIPFRLKLLLYECPYFMKISYKLLLRLR
ncbi:MAG: sulfotransferase [Bacteroidales bacterium]|nr:sulfotransferase [Bacteroidales bacterium]